MNLKPVIFVVRVWHHPQGFRASARSTQSEITRYFIRPEELLRYLLEENPQDAHDRGLESGGEW